MFPKKILDAITGRSDWGWLVGYLTVIGGEMLLGGIGKAGSFTAPRLAIIALMAYGLFPVLRCFIRQARPTRKELAEFKKAMQEREEKRAIWQAGFAVEMSTLESFSTMINQLREDVREGRIDRYDAAEKLGAELNILRLTFADPDDLSHQAVARLITDIEPMVADPAKYF
jgi:hypothetical protein